MLRIILFLLILSGCENPFGFGGDTEVTIIITGINDEAEEKEIREELVSLVQSKYGHSTSSGMKYENTLDLYLSPVKDINEFARSIPFGKVTEVEDCNNKKDIQTDCSRKIYITLENRSIQNNPSKEKQITDSKKIIQENRNYAKADETSININEENLSKIINNQFAEYEIKPALNTQYIFVGGRGIDAEKHGNELRVKIHNIRLEKRPDKTETNYRDLGISIYPLQERRNRDSRVFWNQEIRGTLTLESPVEEIQDQVFIIPGIDSICENGCRARLLLGVITSQNSSHAENTEFAPLNITLTQNIKIPAPIPSKYWDTYYKQAVNAKQQRKYEQAEQLFKETLTFIEKNLGADHPGMGQTLFTMAHIYKEQNKYDTYEKVMLQALEVLEKNSDKEVMSELGSRYHLINKEQLAYKLADWYWDQRRYNQAFVFYKKAYDAIPELETTDYNRNLRFAFDSSGIMKTACVLKKWDIADKAMAELKERYKDLEPGAQKEMDYWIRTGEPRLKKRDC